MLATNVDLFGEPIPIPSTKEPKSTYVAPRAKWKEDGISRILFDVLEYLKAPMIPVSALPEEFRNTDRREVALIDESEFEEIDEGDGPVIQRIPWGDVWLDGPGTIPWSPDALRRLQYSVFWESMEELSLVDNEQEKWSVLKWIFMPAIRKYYVYDKRLGYSHCLKMHENGHPFSFHLCCVAAGMDDDILREGVRRNIGSELRKAVTRVCTFA